jgi:hypothetical protein
MMLNGRIITFEMGPLDLINKIHILVQTQGGRIQTGIDAIGHISDQTKGDLVGQFAARTLIWQLHIATLAQKRHSFSQVDKNVGHEMADSS